MCVQADCPCATRSMAGGGTPARQASANFGQSTRRPFFFATARFADDGAPPVDHGTEHIESQCLDQAPRDADPDHSSTQPTSARQTRPTGTVEKRGRRRARRCQLGADAMPSTSCTGMPRRTLIAPAPARARWRRSGLASRALSAPAVTASRNRRPRKEAAVSRTAGQSSTWKPCCAKRPKEAEACQRAARNAARRLEDRAARPGSSTYHRSTPKRGRWERAAASIARRMISSRVAPRPRRRAHRRAGSARARFARLIAS